MSRLYTVVLLCGLLPLCAQAAMHPVADDALGGVVAQAGLTITNQFGTPGDPLQADIYFGDMDGIDATLPDPGYTFLDGTQVWGTLTVTSDVGSGGVDDAAMILYSRLSNFGLFLGDFHFAQDLNNTADVEVADFTLNSFEVSDIGVGMLLGDRGAGVPFMRVEEGELLYWSWDGAILDNNGAGIGNPANASYIGFRLNVGCPGGACGTVDFAGTTLSIAGSPQPMLVIQVPQITGVDATITNVNFGNNASAGITTAFTIEAGDLSIQPSTVQIWGK